MASLYIHVPFCARKCVYCDFASYDNQSARIKEYFDALREEIRLSSKINDFHGVSTVFFGGGTPSFVDAAYIAQTLEAVQTHIGILPGAEITIEANPNSLDTEKLNAYLAAGVSRLSMGLQSADDRILEFLGRLHTRAVFHKAYVDAREAGFKNIGVDLIYGIPEQSLEDFARTLEYVAGLAPEHVSAYSLTIEQGTPLHADLLAGKIQEMGEDAEREMYHTAVSFLKSCGYGRYEISNFARPGLESRHNLAYWNREDYLGAGAAAHSCVREARFANTSDLDAYISCLRSRKMAYNTIERLDARDRETEYILLKLRLAQGIVLAEYGKLFGSVFMERFAAPMAKLRKAGLLRESGGRVFLTDRGFDLHSTVVLELLNNV